MTPTLFCAYVLIEWRQVSSLHFIQQQQPNPAVPQMGTFGMMNANVTTTTTGLAPPPNQYGDASNNFSYSIFAAQPPATTLTQQQQLQSSSYGGSEPPPSYSDVMQGAAGAPPRPSFAGPCAPPLDDDDTYILQPIVVQNAAYPGQLPSPMTRLL